MSTHERSDPERPVFIFSAGWRTGSTLLQRLICSSPNILIWGENRGLLDYFEGALRTVDGLQLLSRRHAEEFRSKGTAGWVAMMNPPLESFDAGLRCCLEAYYRDPTRAFGRTRWGFKEVRHGKAVAKLLTRLYPEASFLLLVRDPSDCLASARATSPLGLTKGLLDEVGGPAAFLQRWRKLAAEFLEDWGQVRRLALRYEDLISQPEKAIGSIAEFLAEPRDSFDPAIFKIRRRGWLELPPRRGRDDSLHLDADATWAVAHRWGYEPRGS